MANAFRIMRSPEVIHVSGMPRSTLVLHISKGLWPRPISLGGTRSVGWISSEVDAVLVARVAGKSDEEIKQLVRNLEAQRTAAMPKAA
ncbi:MAG: helix-turn-helix transcriptional regulator [Rhodocyclaceae bacterium]